MLLVTGGATYVQKYYHIYVNVNFMIYDLCEYKLTFFGELIYTREVINFDIMTEWRVCDTFDL